MKNRMCVRNAVLLFTSIMSMMTFPAFSAPQLREGYISDLALATPAGPADVSFRMTPTPPVPDIRTQQSYVTSNICGLDASGFILPYDANSKSKELYGALLTANVLKRKVEVMLQCDTAINLPVVQYIFLFP